MWLKIFVLYLGCFSVSFIFWNLSNKWLEFKIRGTTKSNHTDERIKGAILSALFFVVYSDFCSQVMQQKFVYLALRLKSFISLYILIFNHWKLQKKIRSKRSKRQPRTQLWDRIEEGGKVIDGERARGEGEQDKMESCRETDATWSKQE